MMLLHSFTRVFLKNLFSFPLFPQQQKVAVAVFVLHWKWQITSSSSQTLFFFAGPKKKGKLWRNIIISLYILNHFYIQHQWLRVPYCTWTGWCAPKWASTCASRTTIAVRPCRGSSISRSTSGRWSKSLKRAFSPPKVATSSSSASSRPFRRASTSGSFLQVCFIYWKANFPFSIVVGLINRRKCRFYIPQRETKARTFYTMKERKKPSIVFGGERKRNNNRVAGLKEASGFFQEESKRQLRLKGDWLWLLCPPSPYISIFKTVLLS